MDHNVFFMIFRSYLYRRESVRLHRRKSVGYLIEQEAPTTAPKDWPGNHVVENNVQY